MPADRSGLTSAEVEQRIAAGQVNTLPARSGRSRIDIVRANVLTRVNAILLALFVCVAITGHLIQGVFGFLIVINSVIGIVQELRAKRTLDSLAVVGEAHPCVIRNGLGQRIVRDAVVLDDLIEVTPGEQIVVDGVVVSSDYLEVDESLLTGEADPLTKRPGDRVLSGSFVVSGIGRYRAEKVGADAYAAQITAQAAKFSLVSSELRQGINKILRFVTWLLIPVGALNIYVQFTQPDTTWQESVLRTVAALVPMVPEGLVLLTSMAFALGVIRLGRRNCLVQELPALEGLARVSVVCADKTGTLTKHALTLGEIIALGCDPDEVSAALAQLVVADPTPNASMQAIETVVNPASHPWPLIARVPFSSTRKWSGASFEGHGTWLLGAADVLAPGPVAQQAEEIGATGRRVLLLARSDTPLDSPAAPGHITACALLVLDQVTRDDAAQTLRYFRDQDVALKVISGDNAASVGAVTSSLGVQIGEVVDARTLPGPGTEFDQRVASSDVFGRVTPEQKRQMVDALQAQGHSVAMTGDGVNDVLALKDADLGVAMGSGSSATKAVAQIVLLDDRFSSLPHVVAEGRRVIGNIERVAKLFLTKTIYAALLALAAGVLRLPNPFLPLHMTVVGWFTIGIPAFLMSLAPNRERARPGFVRRTLTVAVPGGAIVAAAALTTYLSLRGLGEVGEQIQTQASTATLITLIMAATWVLSVVARPYVWWRAGLVLFAYAFYFALFALPTTHRWLTLDTSNLAGVTLGVVVGLIAMGAIEALWWITAWIRNERPTLWGQSASAAAQ